MNPWMPENQIQIIKKYLKESHIMLEYGVGGSTLYFAKYVNKYISIEHDYEWIEKIKNLENFFKNIELHYYQPNNPVLGARPAVVLLLCLIIFRLIIILSFLFY